MDPLATQAEPTVVRRVFEAWSIEIPVSLAETFIDADSYWHAYDDHHSVSLTSIVVTDKRGPVSAQRIVRHVPPMDGDNVRTCPPVWSAVP